MNDLILCISVGVSLYGFVSINQISKRLQTTKMSTEQRLKYEYWKANVLYAMSIALSGFIPMAMKVLLSFSSNSLLDSDIAKTLETTANIASIVLFGISASMLLIRLIKHIIERNVAAHEEDQ